MKWSKLTGDLAGMSGKEIKHFKDYDSIIPDEDPSKPEGQKIAVAAKGGNTTILSEWVTYHNLERKNMRKKQQRKYEIFVGGYLSFYDEKLLPYLQDDLKAKGKVDVGDPLIAYIKDRTKVPHEVFFEWGKEDIEGERKMFVRIYLNPPAGNPDPPTPPAPPPPEMIA
jgi:hypothetical protein